ncbi:Gram-negative bacteria binding protein 3 [Carabus blaptoides fortunei]
MEFTLKWLALFVILGIVKSDFTVPKAEIEVLQPKGIRVSIPGSPGITFTEFHANINKEIKEKELGDIFIRVTHPQDGNWMFIDRDQELKQGDVLHYWIYVHHEGLGYTKHDLSFKVE